MKGQQDDIPVKAAPLWRIIGGNRETFLTVDSPRIPNSTFLSFYIGEKTYYVKLFSKIAKPHIKRETKMEPVKIVNEIKKLPPEAQQQVFDFIAFMKSRYKHALNKKRPQKGNLDSENFIGIWKDREDMKDNRNWLRNICKTECGDPSV